VVSVTAKIFTVLRALRRQPRLDLPGLFDPGLGRSGLVATFLAVLELIRSGKIYLEDSEIRMRGGSEA
jgi:segregation and condensation protein A